MKYTLRVATPDDAPTISRLSAMFGYRDDADAHRRRLHILLAKADHAVLVAVSDDAVTGWLHVMLRHSLESESFAEIAGLVVDEQLRSTGIGAALVAAAEDWARQRGHHEVRVRSNLSRERAHAFYRRQGYAATKHQQVFAKRIS